MKLVNKSLPNEKQKLCGNSMKHEYYELIQNTLETTIVKIGLKTHASNKHNYSTDMPKCYI